jgi:phosphatidylglycerol:prolipoprotein diacylglycerol transferase
MIELPFAPDLVVGSARVAWHSIFSFIGSALAVVLAVRLARWLVRDDRPWPYMIAVCLSGLVTARIGHVIDNWPAYAGDPLKAIAFTGGGIAVTAAPVGSTIAGVIMARRLRLPVGFMLDVAAIGIVVGLAVGRIGDIVNGEHHAIACALPWCVRYTHPETLGQSSYVHPVVVYDALLDLAIAAVAYAYWRGAVRGRAPEGRAYLLILGAYGVGRFVTSFLRLDPVLVAGLQEAQLLGLAYALLAVPLVIVLERRARRA